MESTPITLNRVKQQSLSVVDAIEELYVVTELAGVEIKIEADYAQPGKGRFVTALQTLQDWINARTLDSRHDFCGDYVYALSCKSKTGAWIKVASFTADEML